MPAKGSIKWGDDIVAQWAVYYLSGMLQKDIGAKFGLKPKSAPSIVSDRMRQFLRKYNKSPHEVKRYSYTSSHGVRVFETQLNQDYRKLDLAIAVDNWARGLSCKPKLRICVGASSASVSKELYHQAEVVSGEVTHGDDAGDGHEPVHLRVGS